MRKPLLAAFLTGLLFTFGTLNPASAQGWRRGWSGGYYSYPAPSYVAPGYAPGYYGAGYMAPGYYNSGYAAPGYYGGYNNGSTTGNIERGFVQGAVSAVTGTPNYAAYGPALTPYGVMPNSYANPGQALGASAGYRLFGGR